MNRIEIPRVMITGIASHTGKTTVTCGLLSCLLKRGMKVTGFKCGPDYIDSLYHSKTLGVDTGNLDSYFCDGKTLKELLVLHGAGYDISVVEGVMGYFDGIGMQVRGSSADTARLTETPAVLIVPCKGISNSVKAILKGFRDNEMEEFGGHVCLKGVIFNELVPYLYQEMAELAEEIGLRPLGYIPHRDGFMVERRHLGLVMPWEVARFHQLWGEIADVMEETVDIDGLLEIASAAPALEPPEKAEEEKSPAIVSGMKKEPLKIGIVRDEAFCFLYKDNITFLERMGCEAVYFSLIHDEKLPDGISALYLTGGYPENYGKELEENIPMRKAVRQAFLQDMPIIAECGGFLYLHDRLECEDGKMHDMAGLIHCTALHRDKFSGNGHKRFGYIEMEALEDNLLCRKGETLKAHEFHRWESETPGESFHCVKPGNGRAWDAGFATPCFYAGFPHIYFYGNKKAGKRFIEAAAAFRKRKESENGREIGIYD